MFERNINYQYRPSNIIRIQRLLSTRMSTSLSASGGDLLLGDLLGLGGLLGNLLGSSGLLNSLLHGLLWGSSLGDFLGDY